MQSEFGIREDVDRVLCPAAILVVRAPDIKSSTCRLLRNSKTLSDLWTQNIHGTEVLVIWYWILQGRDSFGTSPGDVRDHPKHLCSATGFSCFTNTPVIIHTNLGIIVRRKTNTQLWKDQWISSHTRFSRWTILIENWAMMNTIACHHVWRWFMLSHSATRRGPLVQLDISVFESELLNKTTQRIASWLSLEQYI